MHNSMEAAIEQRPKRPHCIDPPRTPNTPQPVDTLPLDRRYFEGVRARLSVARRLDKLAHRTKMHQSAHAWVVRNAEVRCCVRVCARVYVLL